MLKTALLAECKGFDEALPLATGAIAAHQCSELHCSHSGLTAVFKSASDYFFAFAESDICAASPALGSHHRASAQLQPATGDAPCVVHLLL
jgi:hypothetical protein